MAPATSPAGQCHGTLNRVPGKGTKKRTLRVEDALWDPFGEATQAAGRDRNGVVKDFMRWYLGIEGAELPERPDPEEA